MIYTVLAVGDVVSPRGVEELSRRLGRFRAAVGADLCVVNGENAAPKNGIDPASADAILMAGADAVTTGNHVWRYREIGDYLDSGKPVIRPANFPPQLPGAGSVIVEAAGKRWLVINVMGVIYGEPLADPFEAVEKQLAAAQGDYDFALLDIHAETTSEKAAIARYFDGRIPIVFGTHTHVATADERILPNGTGFITDLGMSGPVDSILGVKSDCIIRKLTTHMPQRFDFAEGPIDLCGALFTLDGDSGRVTAVRRVVF